MKDEKFCLWVSWTGFIGLDSVLVMVGFGVLGFWLIDIVMLVCLVLYEVALQV